MIKLLKNYWRPTPIWAKKFGDALLAIFGSFSTYSLIVNDKTWGIIFLIIGISGKFLSNFFSLNTTTHKIDEDQGCNCDECNCKAAEDQTPIKDNTDEH